METLCQSKTCAQCHTPLQGRADKKFCDDHCRNSFNNQQNSVQNNYMRRVSNILMRNRRILAEYLGSHEKMARVSAEELINKGFRTEFFTNTFVNKKGQTYTFNFEYGYLVLDAQHFLIVRKI